MPGWGLTSETFYTCPGGPASGDDRASLDRGLGLERLAGTAHRCRGRRSAPCGAELGVRARRRARRRKARIAAERAIAHPSRRCAGDAGSDPRAARATIRGAEAAA